jgi:hypothetical protein
VLLASLASIASQQPGSEAQHGGDGSGEGGEREGEGAGWAHGEEGRRSEGGEGGGEGEEGGSQAEGEGGLSAHPSEVRSWARGAAVCMLVWACRQSRARCG